MSKVIKGTPKGLIEWGAKEGKMLTLMASYDCGMSYSPELKTDDLKKLREKGEKLDDQMLRWYIANEDGSTNKEFACKIHKGIVDFMVAINKGG